MLNFFTIFRGKTNTNKPNRIWTPVVKIFIQLYTTWAITNAITIIMMKVSLIILHPLKSIYSQNLISSLIKYFERSYFKRKSLFRCPSMKNHRANNKPKWYSFATNLFKIMQGLLTNLKWTLISPFQHWYWCRRQVLQFSYSIAPGFWN